MYRCHAAYEDADHDAAILRDAGIEVRIDEQQLRPDEETGLVLLNRYQLAIDDPRKEMLESIVCHLDEEFANVYVRSRSTEGMAQKRRVYVEVLKGARAGEVTSEGLSNAIKRFLR